MSFKRRTPTCHCGWKWAGFHICVDLSGPEPIIGGAQHSVKADGKRYTMTDEHRENLRRAAQRRWETRREETRERDRKLVTAYIEGQMSLTKVAKKFDMSKDSALKILHAARDRGEMEMRPRSANIRYAQ